MRDNHVSALLGVALRLLSSNQNAVASNPPSLLSRDLKLLGEDCRLSNWGNNDVWTYEGNTADGRPYYHNTGKDPLFGTGRKSFYIYYDANCDGKTGPPHSKNGHPQWVLSRYKPSLTRAHDLEDDGKCVGDVREAAMHSLQATFDWTFTMGDVMAACPHWPTKPDWAKARAYGGLVGCPKPQPSYTLAWGGWASVDGRECGGEEMRTQIEVCVDTSQTKDCPCTGRRDTAIAPLKETRPQASCRTTITTSTSTTTTTTTTTTTAATASQATTSSSSSYSSPYSSTSTHITTSTLSSPSPPPPPSPSPSPSPSMSPSPSPPKSPPTSQTATKATPTNESTSLGSGALAASKERSGGGGDAGGGGDGTVVTGPGNGVGGGTLAAVIMGAAAAIGLVVGVFKWRSNSRANVPPPAVAHFNNNRTFDPAGSGTTATAAATTAGRPPRQPSSSTLYAVPMEASGGGPASTLSTKATAGGGGEVMYVSVLDEGGPECGTASANISALYTVVTKLPKPTASTVQNSATARPLGSNRNGGGRGDGDGDGVDGRYSGYEPPPGSTIEYATLAADGGAPQYDLAMQDNVENHYDLPAPGDRRRRTPTSANHLQSEA